MNNQTVWTLPVGALGQLSQGAQVVFAQAQTQAANAPLANNNPVPAAFPLFPAFQPISTMPSQPSYPRKLRKGTTLRKKRSLDDVWDRTLNYMGLTPLNSKRISATMTTAMAASSATSSPSPNTTSGKPKAEQLTFLNLPLETQRYIFKHVPEVDLISLSLVSKRFRDLAAEHLYRSFHIVFADDDDPADDSPIDALAGGFDTFVTSDYNYAAHLREIIMETLSGGDKGERSYRHYLYDVSCGKFFNTMLLLTLRKAKSLESFRWDIRVELSREVFHALHQIGALQNLHLRMQAGASIYQPPPPILGAGTVTPTGPFPTNSFPSASKASKKSTKPSNLVKKAPTIKSPPPTFSGFKNLKSLSILDMDTLDYVDEIKTCVRNSSSTLNSLELSFSEFLANKSRRPQIEVQSDSESDQEDEFGNVILQPGPPPPNPSAGASDPNGPTKALKAQEERKNQEAVLGRIFAIESVTSKVKSPAKVEPEKREKKKPETDLTKRFVNNLKPVATALMQYAEPGKEKIEAKKTLALIEKACKQYLAGGDPVQDQASTSGGSSATATTAASSVISAGDDALTAETTDGPGLFDDVPDKKKTVASDDTGVSNPDDIDIEEPEGNELVIEDEPLPEESLESKDAEGDDEEEPLPESNANEQIDAVDLWSREIDQLIIKRDNLTIRTDEISATEANIKKALLSGQGSDEEPDALVLKFSTIHVEYEEVAQQLKEIAQQLEELAGKLDAAAQSRHEQIDSLGGPSSRKGKEVEGRDKEVDMKSYVRNTRGLQLTHLAIYLIPLRSNVLSKAIDFSVLTSITLLNVGPQIPFWGLVARENQSNGRLPLRKIHTDNVTLPFLTVVAHLEKVEELLLLERAAKTKVESTTPKTQVNIQSIRKLALKKHSPFLKVLMIRNDASPDWDLDTKSTMLICQKAKKLEELACSFGTKTMHTLLQFMPGLTSLRALHTIQFRTDDPCPWIPLEFRKFTADNISHNPEMKLEYLALDTTVDRLVRRIPKPQFNGKEKGKKKRLAELVMPPEKMSMQVVVEHFPGLGFEALMVDSDDEMGGSGEGKDGESEDDGEWVRRMGLRIEVVEGVRFCDVSGVRIFDKDVRGGRL